MGALEEVQRMQQSGMAESEIVAKLQEQGVSYRDISDAIAQSKIKAAVGGQYNSQQEQPQPNYETDETAVNNSFIDAANVVAQPPQGMQPSLLQAPAPASDPNQQEYFPTYEQNAATAQGAYDYSQGYDYTSSALSSDTITEISEQIVSEKMADVRRKMEKIISMKTELEAKTEAMEERLKRIEKIIDALQASVLRKVGDYVTNVEDIKHELIETQKTFAKALGTKHEKQEHKK